jgi:hypothetical protein
LDFIEEGFHKASEEVVELRRENEEVRKEIEEVQVCKLPQAVDYLPLCGDCIECVEDAVMM